MLAIGNDVYCDTSLIAYAIERRFPESAGHGTLFPKRKGANGKADTGMIKAFAQSYPDKSVFPLAAGLLPWKNFPESFLKDRSDVCPFHMLCRVRLPYKAQYSGGKINVDAMMARQPIAQSLLVSNLVRSAQLIRDWRGNSSHIRT